VFHESREQIHLELEQVSLLIDSFRPHIGKIVNTKPDLVTITALAGFLQSFYNGIENTLKTISKMQNIPLPKGEAWHKRLLENMSGDKKGILSKDLLRRLWMYLDFRHVCRHAYSFKLHRDKMSDLVYECEQTFIDSKKEIEAFLEK
jgi:hypothetical protein